MAKPWLIERAPSLVSLATFRRRIEFSDWIGFIWASTPDHWQVAIFTCLSVFPVVSRCNVHWKYVIWICLHAHVCANCSILSPSKILNKICPKYLTGISKPSVLFYLISTIMRLRSLKLFFNPVLACQPSAFWFLRLTRLASSFTPASSAWPDIVHSNQVSYYVCLTSWRSPRAPVCEWIMWKLSSHGLRVTKWHHFEISNVPLQLNKSSSLPHPFFPGIHG